MDSHINNNLSFNQSSGVKQQVFFPNSNNMNINQTNDIIKASSNKDHLDSSSNSSSNSNSNKRHAQVGQWRTPPIHQFYSGGGNKLLPQQIRIVPSIAAAPSLSTPATMVAPRGIATNTSAVMNSSAVTSTTGARIAAEAPSPMQIDTAPGTTATFASSSDGLTEALREAYRRGTAAAASAITKGVSTQQETSSSPMLHSSSIANAATGSTPSATVMHQQQMHQPHQHHLQQQYPNSMSCPNLSDLSDLTVNAAAAAAAAGLPPLTNTGMNNNSAAGNIIEEPDPQRMQQQQQQLMKVGGVAMSFRTPASAPGTVSAQPTTNQSVVMQQPFANQQQQQHVMKQQQNNTSNSNAGVIMSHQVHNPSNSTTTQLQQQQQQVVLTHTNYLAPQGNNTNNNTSGNPMTASVASIGTNPTAVSMSQQQHQQQQQPQLIMPSSQQQYIVQQHPPQAQQNAAAAAAAMQMNHQIKAPTSINNTLLQPQQQGFAIAPQRQHQHPSRSISMPDIAAFAHHQQQQHPSSIPSSNTSGTMGNHEDEKRKKRLARNRASARLRRLKKKTLVDSYEGEVGVLEEALERLRAHKWGGSDNGRGGESTVDTKAVDDISKKDSTSTTKNNSSNNHEALLDVLSMDRGQQPLTTAMREEIIMNILKQQMEQVDNLLDVQMECGVLGWFARQSLEEQRQRIDSCSDVGENNDSMITSIIKRETNEVDCTLMKNNDITSNNDTDTNATSIPIKTEQHEMADNSSNNSEHHHHHNEQVTKQRNDIKKEEDEEEEEAIAKELEELLCLSTEQKHQLVQATQGAEQEREAIRTVHTCLDAMHNSDWLLNKEVEETTSNFTSILNSGQMSKFLQWTDHNADSIDQLDYVRVAPETFNGGHDQGRSSSSEQHPTFVFGTDDCPQSLLGDHLCDEEPNNASSHNTTTAPLW